MCSLIAALQALKLAESSEASAKLSYGWQRAEVLGALINGVFLLALCFSIGMEAIARFINYTGKAPALSLSSRPLVLDADIALP